MRSFIMIRRHDESGVSGTGKVLEGVEFSNGFVAIHWFGKHQSVNLYKSMEDFIEVHINSHPKNLTQIIWGDGNIIDYPIPESNGATLHA